MITKEPTPSQRALDHAAKLAGLDASTALDCLSEHLRSAIHAHARTLDQLWERCPDLVPKSRGELFAEELFAEKLHQRRMTDKSGHEDHVVFPRFAAQMISENWEPKL